MVELMFFGGVGDLLKYPGSMYDVVRILYIHDLTVFPKTLELG